MKFKELFYIFEITFGLTFTIWFLIEIIMINIIVNTYEICLIDVNIENENLIYTINSNNIWLICSLLISINYTLFFTITYMRYKRKQNYQKRQRKQIGYNLIDI